MNMIRIESGATGHLKHLLALSGVCVLQLALAAAAHAATACIAANTNLNNTFNAIKGSSEPTTLNLEEGTYQLGAENVTFTSPVAFVGGFKPGTLCAVHDENADKTVIDFGSMQNSVEFDQPRGSPNGLLSFADLTLRNGNTLELWSGAEADPPYLGQHDHAGTIVLSHVRITSFHFVDLGTYYGHVNVTDSLFDHLYPGGTCAITMSPFDDSEAVFNHVTIDLLNNRDLCLNFSTNDSATWNYTFANSIIWSSDGSLGFVNGLNNDPYYPYGDQNHVIFDHTLFKAFVGGGSTTIHNQISADPQWVNPGAGDYHLQYPPQALSPAINVGAQVDNVPEPFTDIDGAVRKIGSKADLGAYESPYNDASVFTVTNTSDCSVAGCGSLRDAINLAHNSAAPSVTINFNIPGGACPNVISLTGALPDIDKPVTINGYSQPLSAVNADDKAFLANLCVVLQPANGVSVFYGLRVPAQSNGSLTLEGVGFGGFGVGVLLFGGSGHTIIGSQFGGYVDNYAYYLNPLVIAGIYFDAASGQIGGYDNASRNAFLHVSSNGGPPASAIEIGPDANGAQGACQVVGNTIGVEDDGTFSGRNTDYGIYVLGNNCLLAYNRIAGMNYDGIFIDGTNGGGSYNVVQNNVLGLVPYGFDLSSSNSGAGVRVTGVKNVIGASVSNGGTATFQNQIRYFDAGGVIVSNASAFNQAYGNTIRGNAIQDNGVDGGGMSIDLGGDGPTLNDGCDCDTGPNDDQNFPTLHSIAWSLPPQLNGQNLSAIVSGMLRTFPGNYYQIDVYYADSCGDAHKGIAQQWIGSNDFVGLPAQTYFVPFSAQVTVPTYVPAKGGALSVTATNNINGVGDTSEVSTCFPIDGVFRDGNEGGYGLD